MRNTTTLLCVSLFTCSFWVGIAQADDDQNVESAHVLFNAGAKAYEAGRFDDAVTAFREAHSLAPDRPTVLFSLAQAERRQFTITHDVAMLDSALTHFRKYLEMITEGGRRADAVVAIGELEAFRSGLESHTELPVSPARVFITSETPHVTILIDGKPRDRVPIIEDIPPGKHVISVESAGFIKETREISAVRGTIFPLEINLREKPSFVSIAAPGGATIAIDGQPYGDAPLQRRLELAPGSHWLTVSQRGHLPHGERFVLARGNDHQFDIKLKTSLQRRVSYLFGGTAVVGLGVTIACILGASVEDSRASAIYSHAQKSNIAQTTLDAYHHTLASRDTLTSVSVGSFLLTLTLGVTALSTYWFDLPIRPTSSPQRVHARLSLGPLPGGAFLGATTHF